MFSPLDTGAGAGHSSDDILPSEFYFVWCLVFSGPLTCHQSPHTWALTPVPAVMVGSHGGTATPIDRNLANQVGSDHFS